MEDLPGGRPGAGGRSGFRGSTRPHDPAGIALPQGGAVVPRLQASADTAPSEANEDTIYMVPTSGSTSDTGSTSSVYIEYMLVNGGFERIGTSDVDLTGYATESKVSNAVTEAINLAATDASTKAGNALSNAKSYADGLASNYATAAQGSKADSAYAAITWKTV